MEDTMSKKKTTKLMVVSLVCGVMCLSGVLSLEAASSRKFVRAQSAVKKAQVKTVPISRKLKVKPVALKPDLKITFAKHLESNVYRLKVTVKNVGPKTAGACILRVEDLTNKSQIKKKDFSFAALAGTFQLSQQNNPSNVRTVYLTLPFTVYGNKYIRVTIDATSMVSELKENNNTYICDTLIK